MLQLKADNIILNQTFSNCEAALKFCGEALVSRKLTTSDYLSSMKRRQARASVYIGNFVALPHGEDDSAVLEEGILLVQVPDGVDFGEADEGKVATILFVVALKSQSQLTALQELALFCSDIKHVAALADATSISEVQAILAQS